MVGADGEAARGVQLKMVQDSFAQTGDLAKALAAQAAVKIDPTAETIYADIKEIAAVQRTFIDAQNGMQKRRDESHAKLALSHIAQLTTIKKNLTKAHRFDSALVLEQEIKKITTTTKGLLASLKKPQPQVVAKPNLVSDFEWKAIRGEVTITFFVGNGVKVVIPNRIDGKPVTSIGDGAFNECKRLKSIAIPDSITSIGSRAFYSCSALTSVTIPRGRHQHRLPRVRILPLTDQRHDSRGRDQYRRLRDRLLPLTDQRHHSRGRHQHRPGRVRELQRTDQRHDSRGRHQHRRLGVRQLQRTDQRHDSLQRHQHRPIRVQLLQQLEEHHDW